jgi:thymidylate synthase (FAD)
MRIVDQSWDFESQIDGEAILDAIERAGRTCYKSEDRITEDSAERFVASIIKRGHESVLEHQSISVRIITDRGVSHEIVRHRLASYSQESTRYCNYGGCVQFINPVDFEFDEVDLAFLKAIEAYYSHCLELGRTPQQARYFLPNGTKTEIVMTANLREWRHFFRLRTSKAAHPQMRALAIDMLRVFKAAVPVVFDDIEVDL